MKKRMNVKLGKQAVVAALCGVTASGCGSSSTSSVVSAVTTALTSASLTSLPSTSGMLTTNSSSSSVVNRSSGLLSQNKDASYAVSGTAPLLSTLKANADTYFWNGLVATLNNTAQGSVTQAQKNQFWGGVDGGPGGMGACMMAQSVGEAFGRMLQSGTSLCYMKNVPSMSSGITITGATASTVFDQQASDKLVKIAASMNGVSQQDIFIKVYGTNSLSSGVNKWTLYFCSNSAVTGFEQIEVNKTTGVYSSTSYQTSQDGSGKMAVSAYLKSGSDGTISFDPSKDRTATATFTGTWGKFKNDLTITSSNQILNKMMNINDWGTNKTYSIAKFSGTGLSTFRFLEAGFNSYSTDGSHSNSFSGGIEWKDNFYAAATSSSLKTDAEKVSLTTDSFYTGITAPTEDVSSYSCSATADVTATMDMGDAAFTAVQTKCEADRFNDYDMCWNSSVNTAQAKTYQ